MTPSPAEQLFLTQLNAARANPPAYGASIGVDLRTVPPAPPLTFDLRLVAAAREHSHDMAARAYFAHTTPEGLTAAGQIERAGYDWQGYGQSIAAGSIYAQPAEALKALIIDAGVPGAGHRRHLLGIGQPFATLDAVGVGIFSGGGPYTHYYTINTGRSAVPQPYVAPEPVRVRQWYLKFLDRLPDPVGEKGMVNYLLSGASEADALAVILASAEYYARTQVLGPGPMPERRFLNRLYLDTLGRLADLSGTVFWGSQVVAGRREPVVRAVLASDEYARRG